MSYPDDNNGDVFRRMAASGMDFSQTHRFDFTHRFDTSESAMRMADEIESLGHESSVLRYEDDPGYYVQVIIRMRPDYERVTALEARFAEVAGRFGGEADGWGVLQEE